MPSRLWRCSNGCWISIVGRTIRCLPKVFTMCVQVRVMSDVLVFVGHAAIPWFCIFKSMSQWMVVRAASCGPTGDVVMCGDIHVTTDTWVPHVWMIARRPRDLISSESSKLESILKTPGLHAHVLNPFQPVRVGTLPSCNGRLHKHKSREECKHTYTS